MVIKILKKKRWK